MQGFHLFPGFLGGTNGDLHGKFVGFVGRAHMCKKRDVFGVAGGVVVEGVVVEKLIGANQAGRYVLAGFNGLTNQNG